MYSCKKLTKSEGAICTKPTLARLPEAAPCSPSVHLVALTFGMAGGRRRHAKRPAPVQPLPLAPGANRFQPSEAYLARISQQSASLTPATSPAFWPPVATPHQATAPAQPSAAARWVQEQERVHETSGFAPPPSVARSASEDVEQHSRHASMYSDIVPAPPGELRQFPPLPWAS